MIKIDNLTARQRVILDQLWSMDSQDDVHDWISTLDESEQQMAHVLAQLLILEHIDSVLDLQPHDYPEVRKILRNLGKNT